jgi:2'-hydroxyisoflavone reductase
MAAWMMDLIEGEVSGTFHAMNPPPPFTMGQLFAAMREVASPPGATLTWADEEFLLRAGESGETLPLWSGGDPGSLLLTADPSRALESGLKPRVLADTIKDTLEWAKNKSPESGPRMTSEREAELLARWHEF